MKKTSSPKNKNSHTMFRMIILAIVLLGFVLRTWNIHTNPPSLSWDEVSIGYNAYSILETGKSEHQRFLPLDTFIGYGDYKPPVSIYLTVPFVAVFGLNEWAVRLPSAVFGVFTILVTYLLVLELFASDKHRHMLAIASSLLLALSPWHINLSRAGFEGNIAVFFIALGTYLLLVSRRHPWVLTIAAIPHVLAVYTFNSARYFAPLLGIVTLWYMRQHIQKQRKWFTIGAVIAVVCMLPILPHLLSAESRLRFAEVNIFTDASVVERSNERIAEAGNAFWAKIVHNRRVGYLKSFLAHYFHHFEPWFLFGTGDGNPKFSIQDVGQLYIVEAPLLVLGVIWIVRSFPREAILLLLWLFLSIIPAGLARETPHALRIENSLPMWQIFAGSGFVWILLSSVDKKFKAALVSFILLLYVGNVGYYLHNYHNHYPRQYSGEWQYGYKEAIAYVESVKDQYDQVVMTDTLGRPYMYVLFYTQKDPREFWQTAETTFDAAGFYKVFGFDMYRFVRNGPLEFDTNSLYVLTPQFAPDGARVLEEIKLLNGEDTLLVFDTR